MSKDDEILRLRDRILVLENENEVLKRKLNFMRGVPAEMFVAGLTEGKRTRYKDRHDVTATGGQRLEVKSSHLNLQERTKTKRWNWDRLLGLNETKEYDFLVLLGEKDPRFEEQYPADLPYVCFLVPRCDVNNIRNGGNCVALNTNLTTARSVKAQVLKRYLIRTPDQFTNVLSEAAAAAIG
jgi:hypothetical protein